MAEKVEGVLEKFSPLLLQEYIRLTTVSNCLKTENYATETSFLISKENYTNMLAEPLKAMLLDLTFNYDEHAEKLTVNISKKLYDTYGNAIMHEVALKYAETYNHRYDNFIKLASDNI